MDRPYAKDERNTLGCLVIFFWMTGLIGLFSIDYRILLAFLFIWGGQVLYKMWSDGNKM